MKLLKFLWWLVGMVFYGLASMVILPVLFIYGLWLDWNENEK